MELDILDKKIRRLACKLKKYEIQLEVFDHEDIEYGALLGKGGEAIVRKCTVVYNGIPIDGAAKSLLDNSDDAISITLEELELLCLARDPIITTTLQVYGVAAVPDEDNPEIGHLVIITEAGIMNGLQLYQREIVPAYVTLDLWSRLAAAIHCIHLKKIMHQDLKPENILVTGIVRDPLGDIGKIDFKIIDLGMAKRVFNEKVVTEDIVGTNGYHAPEVLFDDTYDFRADIFQLGICFCVMLHSPEFLKSSGLQELLKEIHEAKHDHKTGRPLFEKIIQPTLPDSCVISSSIKSMIIKMLEKQNKRNVSLLDVVEICRDESEEVLQNQSQLPPILSPYMADNSPDSGFEGGAAGKRNSSQRRKPKHPPSANSSGRTTPRSRSSYGSASSVSSSVEIVMSYRPRTTRSMKRNGSLLLQDLLQPDQYDARPPAKRTRSSTSLLR